jgi:hypothetical protein
MWRLLLEYLAFKFASAFPLRGQRQGCGWMGESLLRSLHRPQVCHLAWPTSPSLAAGPTCVENSLTSRPQAPTQGPAKPWHKLVRSTTLSALAQDQNMSANQRAQLRREQAQPKLAQLLDWLSQTLQSSAPNSAIARATSYALKRWSAFTRYADNGQRPAASAQRPAPSAPSTTTQ